ncbi:cupin [Streptomyces sp. H27-H1]|uniref:cupin domain-containing protein n=1 Tax=Streptomyces sp. H27-H1 TaxID=2996461 RepID=UPI0022711919|nr:cupin domain-containing protein [Streptomyces sp. H27-H1]MCY0929204.1 cupin [Streptomyces sp. H27-H1]
MRVIDPSPEHVVTTPNATMTGFASPGRGSAELSTWHAAIPAGITGPEHAVSREQVWTVTAGALDVTCDGVTERVAAGSAVVLPPDVLRRVHALADTEVYVAMRADGLVSVPGAEGSRPLPWAV